MVKITKILIIVTMTSDLSPVRLISAVSADGPVTYTFMPGGGGVRARICRTASMDWLASGPHVAGEVQLHIRGFAIGALRPFRRQRIAPKF